jgi:hypothetical protein
MLIIAARRPAASGLQCCVAVPDRMRVRRLAASQSACCRYSSAARTHIIAARYVHKHRARTPLPSCALPVARSLLARFACASVWLCTHFIN